MRKRILPLACRQCRLDGECAFDRIDDGGKFHQHPVAHQLDDAPAAFGCLGIEYLAPVGLERGKRARLILGHELRIAHHVSGQNGGEPALHGVPHRTLAA